jgi:hypothetical protein
MNAKNITTQEEIVFIEQNGSPDGYALADELKIKLKEYRELLKAKRQHQKTT